MYSSKHRHPLLFEDHSLLFSASFATALAQHLTEGGIKVDKMFRLVIDDVVDATGNKQEPFMYGSLPGRQDFYFRPRSSPASRPA
jgi:hypothetical protein